eukprot:3005761-Prymnesium_polylepis.1
MDTVARTREGVRNTSGITPKRQAPGGAHLGLHCSRRVPQVGTPFAGGSGGGGSGGGGGGGGGGRTSG